MSTKHIYFITIHSQLPTSSGNIPEGYAMEAHKTRVGAELVLRTMQAFYDTPEGQEIVRNDSGFVSPEDVEAYLTEVKNAKIIEVPASQDAISDFFSRHGMEEQFARTATMEKMIMPWVEDDQTSVAIMYEDYQVYEWIRQQMTDLVTAFTNVRNVN